MVMTTGGLGRRLARTGSSCPSIGWSSTLRQANRAAAVGRLMLGETRHWVEFLEADQLDLSALPRRQLKPGKVDVKKRLSAELERFCGKNFKGMTQQGLSNMYEDIKAFRGMEMPLSEFERRFAPNGSGC
jgi:hypothetical protein